MLIHKPFIIIMGIFLVVCAGACNIYPLYLRKLMDKFQFSLMEVNLFGTSINLGLWIALPMGLIYDKYGPKISCTIGAIMLSGTYLVLYLLMNSNLTSFPLILLLLIGFIMGQGSALCYTCALSTNLKNYCFKDSSSIVGLLVANLAISPSIFTTYRQYFTESPISQYFLIISIFIGIVIFICGIVLTNMQNTYSKEAKMKSYEKYKEKKHIKMFIFINIVNLLIYLFGVIMNNLSLQIKFPNVIVYPSLQLLNFLVIIFEYFGVFDKFYFKDFIDRQIKDECKIDINLILQKKKSRNSLGPQESIKDTQSIRHKVNNTQFIFEEVLIDTQKSKIQSPIHTHKDDNINIIPIKKTSDQSKIEFHLDHFNEEKKEQSISVNSAIIITEQDESVDFWKAVLSKQILILFIILMSGIGSVIANLNNIEFIAKSINFKNSANEIYEYVLLYFAFNSFSRIISGVFLDKLIKKGKFFNFLILISFCGLFSQIFGIILVKNCLYISISLAGATHGGYMTFVPVYVRREFGTENYGKILGLLTSGCALGSILVADFVFTVFDYKYNKNSECLEKNCYFYPYLFTIFLMIICCFLSVIFLQIHKKKSFDLK